MQWFDVDKEGLAKLLARKGIEFLLYELVQNSWDTDAAVVDVRLEPIANKPFCTIEVRDDNPEGFRSLAHAWTLFAESEKKADPEKRGRFNLGEKLVLALCEEASIVTTTGSVIFDREGRRTGRSKTNSGSVFRGIVRMTRAQYDEVCAAARKLIVPAGKRTTFNGQTLPERECVATLELTLPTEVCDAGGFLRRSQRKTKVMLYTPATGEAAGIYELGIPVVELTGGEKWHLNVGQKIPLNSDRDNVTPAYLRELRTAVLNEMHKEVKGDEAAASWVRDARESPKVSADAVKATLAQQYGANAVIYDPSDPEANKIAASEGRTVIPGRALSKEEWINIKRDRAVLPAGQVTPSKPTGTVPTKHLKEKDLTPGMKAFAAFVSELSPILLNGMNVETVFVEAQCGTQATWEMGRVTFNVGNLGKQWFESGPTIEQVDLLLHEFGHRFESDHLSKKYNDALTRLGAKLAFYTADWPDFFSSNAWDSKKET